MVVSKPRLRMSALNVLIVILPALLGNFIGRVDLEPFRFLLAHTPVSRIRIHSRSAVPADVGACASSKPSFPPFWLGRAVASQTLYDLASSGPFLAPFGQSGVEVTAQRVWAAIAENVRSMRVKLP